MSGPSRSGPKPKRRTVTLCPVCGANPANTKEDLVPQWYRNRLKKAIAEDGMEIVGQFPSVLMPMCSVGDGMYGRKFENPAAPILSPMMIDGQGIDLNVGQQLTVSRWIFIKVFLELLGRADQTDWQREAGCRDVVHNHCNRQVARLATLFSFGVTVA